MHPTLVLLFLACSQDIAITKHDTDADSDGYLAEVDCDDAHASVNPDAPELCDGLDNDCDGVVDDAATDAASWYADDDGDTFGAGEAVAACEAPLGHVANADDCDDAAPDVNPAGVETCDEVDQDCDGDVDEGAADEPAWYADADDDGYGAGEPLAACEPPAGFVAGDEDCDDARADVNPGAAEADCADPVDYNCDGSVMWADADADGAPACEDCDDADATVGPGATETCDGRDDDCDAEVDEGFDADADSLADCFDSEECDGLDNDGDGVVDEAGATGESDWYADADEDGYGEGEPLAACDAPAGFVGNDEDCDDTDATVGPGATETCNAVDDDCDAEVDEGFDADADTLADCFDSEECDGLDNDGDGAVDEAGAAGESGWYADDDDDGYGAGEPLAACDAPAGFVAGDEDCDDTDATASPVGTEVCGDGVDQDCDGADFVCPAERWSGTSSVELAGVATSGDGSVESYGYAIAGEMDLDGDGYDDLGVGAYAHNDPSVVGTLEGRLYVRRGLLEDGGETVLQLDAGLANGGLGRDVAAIGDPDGDGYDDLLVNGYGSNRGRVYWIEGENVPTSGTTTAYVSAYTTTTWDSEIGGDANDGELGALLDGPGDLSGDGVPDIVLADSEYQGSSTTDRDYGRYYVVPGPFAAGSRSILTDAVATFTGDSTDDWAGRCTSRSGDADGDGDPDLLFSVFRGASGSLRGQLYVYDGETTGAHTLDGSGADAAIEGLADGDAFGWVSDLRGDLDGDGYADLVAGAYGADTGGSASGTVYVLPGPLSGTISASSAILTLIGEDAGDNAGQTLTTLRDVDLDGADELAVGASGRASNAGAVYLLYGGLTGTVDLSAADAVFTGTAGSRTGFELARAGDIDADGAGDLAVGAFYYGTGAGQLYLLSMAAP
ncbi:MAG: MopE-related protein [Pseudomonadota bacterium]|nr:MopE-related protein [Pseudomonadota bacterium]